MPMIISHKFKFIFVKTRKTAGTSIEIFLSRHCGPDDVVTPIIPPVAPHRPRNHGGYHNHMPAHRIRRTLHPDVWNSYFKFCVERNPWDKTISDFAMKRARRGGGLTLERYLAERKFPVDIQKYTEPGEPGRVIVDRVIYYETLLGDLRRILSSLGIPFEGSLNAWAKSEYRTDRRHYSEILSSEQAAVIAGAFRHELDIHGYTFSGPLNQQPQ